ncbi:MAG: SDR family NAD(P)-dependent oxidoreductase [Hyphomicrobiaceae bacterium]
MTLASTSLNGRRALVTGAQQGIGRAVVLALADAGANVAINWLDDKDAALRIADQVTSFGREAMLIQGSVGSKADVQRIVDAAHSGLGGLDILVNNAGVFPRSDFLDLEEAEWDHVLGVNLKGSFLAAQAAARHMVADNVAGAIVNISSSSVRGHVLGVHYSASKTGIIGLTRSMALALAPHGIRVNAIAPGITDTAQPRYQFSETEMAEQSDLVPLGAMAQPGDIADIIVFLSSNASRFMTGELVHANGGLYMG